MPSLSRPALAVLTAVTLALIGAAVAPPTSAAPRTHIVEIADFAFAPATMTITVGDTVTWTNRDPVVHTATGTGGAFDSGDLAQNASFSLTFTAVGTFDYLCTPHPSMTGRIVVQAPAAAVAATPDPAPAPSGGGIPNVAMPPPAPGSLVVAGLALLLIIGLALGVGGPGRPRD